MRKKNIFVATAAAVALVFSMPGAAHASSHQLDQFTQQELNTNWVADRRFPTGGVTSVTAFGRDNVARIGVDSAQTALDGFSRTEGIKTAVGNFGNVVEVDLYLDPAWETNAVRAGLWVVGDASGLREDFGIIEFVNSEVCLASDCPGTHETNRPDHEGFRIWDSAAGGWSFELNTPIVYGTWVTLTISLDTVNNLYSYFIDGAPVGTAAGDGNFIREVFLNSYNYGEDSFPNLTENSYAAHWHAGYLDPSSKGDCKGGGHAAFGFIDQGQCLKFVKTGQDSR